MVVLLYGCSFVWSRVRVQQPEAEPLLENIVNQEDAEKFRPCKLFMYFQFTLCLLVSVKMPNITLTADFIKSFLKARKVISRHTTYKLLLINQYVIYAIFRQSHSG